ncbi:MAG: PLP-dependent aminotransferase family protein [Bacillota bacterium]|nr:PLP-dependent aminotransferase family protein [Bacillota bacterium]
MVIILPKEENNKPYYFQIYRAIREDIENGLIRPDEKLPSKRKLAQDLKVSQTTVETAYGQLKAEGYIYAKNRSGYYAEELPPALKREAVREKIPAPPRETTEDWLYNFQTGSVNTAHFPFSVWARLTRETLSEDKEKLLTVTPPKGLYELRQEICRFLRRSRGIEADPEQVIVGAGWEYLFGLIIQLLGRDKTYGIEEPGYPKAPLILSKAGVSWESLAVDNDGVSIDALAESLVRVLHVTPSHHFPLGIVTSAPRRRQLLAWAEAGGYIIEDDYDSEFRLQGRPIPSIYGMDRGERVIYIKTLARTLAPSLRMAYMVLPRKLLEQYDKELYFYTSTISRIEQHVLTRFIAGGYFERHLNRMRNIYRKNRRVFLEVIKESPLARELKVFRDDGGAHLLLQARSLDQATLINSAAAKGIKITGISAYYQKKVPPQYRNTVVAGVAGFSEGELEVAAKALLSAWEDEIRL